MGHLDAPVDTGVAAKTTSDLVRDVASVAVARRVCGPVLAALEAGAVVGRPDNFAADVAQQLASSFHEQLHSSLMAESDIAAAVMCLREAGIDARVLKGGAAASLDYADPTLRVTSDADVLVPAGALGAATEALRDHIDLSVAPPEFSRPWADRFAKARTVGVIGGGWLDLHQRIDPGPAGFRIPSDALFAEPEWFMLAGVELAAMSAPLRVLHTALHATRPNTGWHSMLDMPVLLDHPAVGWQTVANLATRWGIDGPVAAGVLQVWTELGLDDHPARRWADGIRPGLLERLAARSKRAGAAGHLTAWLALPPHQWPAYLSGMLWPDQEYLTARTGGRRLGHLRRLPSKLLLAAGKRPLRAH